jgi:hypothetical protein
VDERKFQSYLGDLVTHARAVAEQGSNAKAKEFLERKERVENLRMVCHQFFLWANREHAFVWESRTEGGPEDLSYDELIWIATEPLRAACVCVDPEHGRAWIGMRHPHASSIYWHELLHPERWGEKREEELVHTLIHELADQEQYLRARGRPLE